MTKLDKMLY